MTAAAYRYAEGGGVTPREIELGRMINRFGAQAVFGRAMGAAEIRRIEISERIVRLYIEREKSDNWAAWVMNNPGDAELLSMAAELANGE